MIKEEQIIKAFEKCLDGEACKFCLVDICNLDKDCEDCVQQLHKYVLSYINRLKTENDNLTVENEVLKRDVQNLERTLEEANESIKSAVQSFTRMETLYKVKCTELECAEERVRKETAKEILQRLYSWKSAVIFDCDSVVIAEKTFETSIKALAKEDYGVEVEE